MTSLASKSVLLLLSLGVISRISFSGFSIAKDMAGRILVPSSMHKRRRIVKGKGMSNTMNTKNGMISGTFEARLKAIDFFRLSNINLPSLMHSII